MSHTIGDTFLFSSKYWDKTGISGCLMCDGSTYTVKDYGALAAALQSYTDDTGVSFNALHRGNGHVSLRHSRPGSQLPGCEWAVLGRNCLFIGYLPTFWLGCLRRLNAPSSPKHLTFFRIWQRFWWRRTKNFCLAYRFRRDHRHDGYLSITQLAEL